MKVKEIVRLTALLLGREDITAYIDADMVGEFGDDTVAATNTLNELVNLVVGELASTYVPAKKIEQFNVLNGKIYFSSFSETLLKVISVTDGKGTNINYVQYPEYIAVEGPVTVEYQYLPKARGIDEKIAYSQRDVPARILAYGVAAEYCITQGWFDPAVMWHKRYVDALDERITPKNGVMKNRRWG